jgi:crossover junction endodeoxyribonuclease RusA
MLIIEGEPVAKERPRMGQHGKVYTPRATVAYENMIASYAKYNKLNFGRATLVVTIDFYTANPKKPDLDNLIKAVLDGLQRGNAFRDDKQIIELHARRFDGDEKPRVEIEIRKVGP